MLSEQNEFEKTISKLEHELEVRSDKSSFNKINALLQEISELPENLFEID